ncbi:MAG: DUF87 domain-containing protein [Deltaproteobacteria bacterium]|nr:DUF87 domain-containing protein [Deltaproteobacteria bacterium]
MRRHDSVLPFAVVNHRTQRGRAFGIKPADLLHHVWVLGKTGMGKSTLLETLLVAQLEAGHGVGLLDPHGDLVERVLDRIPRARRRDLVLIDPAAAGPQPSLNLVGYRPPGERPLAAAAALSVLKKMFADSWGPRTEHLTRQSLLTLLDVPRSTIAGVLRLIADERFRATAMRHVRDPVVRTFWEEEFVSLPPAFRAEVVAPVQNKIGGLLSNPVVRGLVDQPKAMLPFRKLMDEGRIVVANLSTGRIGEAASAFLGSLLLGGFQMAAYSRAAAPVDERRPFTLYVDELHRFTTPSFVELLAEARKFGLGLVVAHQGLAQLDPSLRGALLGNVGTLIAFRVSADDAIELEPEFAPEQSAYDLSRLGKHEIALKLCVDGVTSEPFTALAQTKPHIT